MSDFSPSLKIENFLGSNLDNDNFQLFLEAYYEWLETTKITLTEISGTFSVGEQIIGYSSKATGIVKYVGSNFLLIKVTSRKVFFNDESITGQTSDATAIIDRIKDNVVKATNQTQRNRVIETTIDNYADYLKSEIYDSFPKEYFGNKRLIATKFREFYLSKGNEKSFEFFFKLLYNEEIQLYFPGEDVLRISDGNFEKTQVIRTDVRDNIFDFLNKTIRGKTSGAIANVIDIKRFFANSIEIAEMTLALTSGTFAVEEIEDVANTSLTTNTYGIISGFTINDAGSGYEVGDEITITGDGAEAEAFVSSIQQSPITAVSLNETGYGYQLNTQAIVNNSGTGGSGLIVKVSSLANTYTITSGANTYTVGEIASVRIVNRGGDYFRSPTITLIDTEISTLGLLSENLITIADAGNNYAVGDVLVFTGGSGANADGQVASVTANTDYSNTVLFEDEFEFRLEGSFYDKLKTEDWDVEGPIARIELTNFGTGYTISDLPTITVTSANGTSANLVVTGIQGQGANVEVDVANNATGIGSIRAIEITNFGIDYSYAGANVALIGDGNANVVPIITGLGIKTGRWIDDDGKIDYKIIQDSFYYQDFSYVIRSGIVFNTYKDNLKRILHPSGLQPFGEILLQLFIDVSTAPDTGLISLIKLEDLFVKLFTLISAETSYANTEVKVALELAAENLGSLIGDNNTYVLYPYNRNITVQLSEVISDINQLIVKIEPSANVAITNSQEYQIEVSPEESPLTLVSGNNQYELEPAFDTKILEANTVHSLANVQFTIQKLENLAITDVKEYIVSYTNPQAAYPTIYRNITVGELQDDIIFDYAEIALEDTFGNAFIVSSIITTANSS